jgi:hypothetical protein
MPPGAGVFLIAVIAIGFIPLMLLAREQLDPRHAEGAPGREQVARRGPWGAKEKRPATEVTERVRESVNRVTLVD